MSDITPELVLAALASHIGAGNGIGVRALTARVTGRDSTPAAERSVRSAINELRRAGHHVCAHPSTGYFIARTPEELDRTCEYLHDRAMCSLEQIAAMKRISVPDLRGQLHLPT
ncbi:MAG TPA: hypothetical protein VKA32_04785 [Gammaproteobacteria bacterium]|nr:hypothetical protein [Gammaproteobacteria bacterium]